MSYCPYCARHLSPGETCSHSIPVRERDRSYDPYEFTNEDARRILDSLHSLHQKVDHMSQQHDEANAALDSANTKLDALTADVQTLIAAITNQNGGTPPTPEDWSDIVAKAAALSQKIGDADNSVKSATPSSATGSIEGKASL